MKEYILQTTIAVAFGALAAYFNILLVPLTILISVMLIDYATGICEAYINKTLNSRIGIKGILKKIGYLVLVCVGGVVDYLISTGLATVDVDFSSYYFGLIIAVWLIVNELISILENLAEIGTPIPKFLINIVHRLKNTVESNADSNTKE